MKKDKKSLLIFVYGPFALILIAVFFFVFHWKDILEIQPPEFSRRNMLQALWYEYKNEYLETGTTRSLDKEQGSITTSEGQSYTMLRSVWMDDKESFDAAWQWTKDNIQRKEDHLVSWLFGERKDGSYGVLTDRGGYNSASDADTDIALALVFAWKRWHYDNYFGDAIVIIRDIWNKEVVMIKGRPYLAANNVEKRTSKSSIIVNPSYFAPYAYKIFAEIDPERDWMGLASTSYEVAQKAIELPLDKGVSARIPPDWIMIDRTTGEIAAADGASLTSNYSFDALRLPWRLAVDYFWTKDPRAKSVLDSIGLLEQEWKSAGTLASTYSHDGKRILEKETPAMYGGSLGFFMIEDPKAAKNLYLSKLESLYDTNESRWKAPQGYYDQNWAWFGMALYAGEIRNIYKESLTTKTP